ncbi:hypothetical protein [Bradyrhizobium sp. CCBAU 11361]|uniref:hypothetical protein n=1 Tax=Bradyrhizobium sp. CCBAU 11361 TaxID=1630812 RepID=UPI002304DF14|nr:hypothetical protein [Bradyrhizobium sp. CCBAU 11361]MDA9494776.1 hypothetical protein [Bradyrhizobium sp. CCBAU 11361]
MSTTEIDRLMRILSERKRAGYFCGFWKTALESADMMLAGEAVIQSMWSPGVSALRRRGFPVRETVRQDDRAKALRALLTTRSRLQASPSVT